MVHVPRRQRRRRRCAGPAAATRRRLLVLLQRWHLRRRACWLARQRLQRLVVVMAALWVRHPRPKAAAAAGL